MTDTPVKAVLPEVLDGYWQSREGYEKALEYVAKQRSDLYKGDVPDLAVASAVYMANRCDLDLIHWQDAAKERIRWLSVQLAITNARLQEQHKAMTDLKGLRERYGGRHLKHACPGDEQGCPPWILRFADQDCRDQIFIGEDAEQQAWDAWNRYAPSYNCYLFQCAPLNTALEHLQAEVERLRKMMGDLSHPAVASACAMLLKHYKPKRCDSEAVSDCINCNTVFLAHTVQKLQPKEQEAIRDTEFCPTCGGEFDGPEYRDASKCPECETPKEQEA